MATAVDRGWPIRQLSKDELYLVSAPIPTRDERAAGVLAVPGFPIRVRKEVGPLFRGLVADLQVLRARTGRPPLLSAGGYNFRPIRGYEEEWGRTRNARYLSNHSWGLAVDLNAGANPMGSPVRSDFPRDETYALAAKWGLSWGREWSRPDPMHFEALLTPEQARVAVARLTAPRPALDFLEEIVAQLTDDEKARFMRFVDSQNRTWDERQKSKVSGHENDELWLAEGFMWSEAHASRAAAASEETNRLLRQLITLQGGQA